jgi:hypothetical protein
MQYFVVMIDYGRRGREAIVDPEITRREVISRILSGEYKNISFIHEIAGCSVEDSPLTFWRKPLSRKCRSRRRISRPVVSITLATCARPRHRDARCQPGPALSAASLGPLL